MTIAARSGIAVLAAAAVVQLSLAGVAAQNPYKVKYDWPLLTGLLTPLLGQNGYVTLSVSAAVRNEPFPVAAGGS